MKRLGSLLFLSTCLFFSGFAQTPYYKNASPTRASGNMGSGVPFGVNASAGARVQYFYPPSIFGSTVPATGVAVNRIYFFADTTYADTITYSSLKITLGEYTSAPACFVSAWNTASTKTTTVLYATTGYTIHARDSNWFYIDFTNPYVYDPSKYLLVDITVGGQTPFISPWFIKSTAPSSCYNYATSSGAASAGSLVSGPLPAMGFDPITGLNNAGLEKPLYASTCASTQDVVVNVKNAGLNLITSVEIDWKVNGVLQTPYSLSATIDTFGSAKNDTLITLGNVNFTTGNKNIIAWTSMPNGVPDLYNTNDTISFTMGASMSGTYTIGGAGAYFPNIAAAVSALKTFGVCGPVTLLIDTSTFVEQVNIIGRINGASPANTITFQGVDKQKSIIAWSSVIVNAKHVIKLQNTAYITFQNLTIKTLNATYGWGVHLIDSCNSVGIKNCIIDISVSSGSVTANNTAGISVSGTPTGTCIPGPCATALTTASRADSLEIDSNTILYGYEGINITGNAAANFGRNNKIRNNTILNAYQNSINLVYQENAQVLNNTIVPRQTGIANVGIFANNVTSTSGGNRTNISGNKISGYSTAGISMNACNSADPSNKGLITNNMIGGLEQLFDAIPVYLTSSSNWSVSHNSINRDFPGTTIDTASGIRIFGTTALPSSNITIMNNIISVSKAGLGLPLSILSATYVDSMDRNILYRADTSGGSKIMKMGATVYTVANFKGAGGFNANAAFLRPPFINDTNLYLQNTCGFPAGIRLSYDTTDIDGVIRNTPPIIGANEKIPVNNNIAVTGLVQPSSPIGPGTYTMKVSVQNMGSNAVTSFSLGYMLNGNTPVTQLITPGSSLNQCDTMTVNLSGFVVGINDSISQLLVYSYLPNTVADADPSNDTIRVKLYSPLGGEYTLGGAGANFVSFAEAVVALQTAGMKSAVKFNVNTGTYNEQVNLKGPIAGSSSVKTITFEGIDATTRKISYSGNGSAPYTVKIENAPYVTFSNLGILATGSTWGWGMQITGTSNACRIKNCVVSVVGSGTTNTTANYAGITVSGSTLTTAARVDSLEIDSNTVNYGYYGINIFAATGNSGVLNKIRNNIVNNAYQNSIYLTFQQTPEVSNNTISCRSAGVGIYCQNVTTPATGTLYTVIRGNKITNYSTAGVYMNTCTNASSTLKGLIINNAIGGLEKSASGNALYLTSSTNWYISNNSINHDYAGTSATTASAIRIVGTVSASFGNTIVNNIIAVTATGTGLPLYTQVAGNVDAMDYNLFYRADTTNGFMMYLGANVTTAALKGFGTFNKYATIYRPGFTTASNLTPNPLDSAAWSINGRGTYVSYSPSDINGIARPALFSAGVPDIGAYEFTPTCLPPLAKGFTVIAGVTIPDTIYAGTIQSFVFAGDTVAKISWSTTVPPTINVRQYSGVRPPLVDTTKNYMYFYTSVSTSSTNSIDIFYRDNWKGTHFNETDIRASQLDSGNTAWSAIPTFSSIDTTKNIITLTYFNTYVSTTYLTGTNDASILPVKLLNISAHKLMNEVLLNWITASEINVNRFEVENSLDGRSFVEAGKITAKGNSNTDMNYQFADKSLDILNAPSGNIYYRLKMIDNDGHYEYSKIVNVQWNDELRQDQITVYPNPFTSDVYINATMTAADNHSHIILMDITGKIIQSKTVSLEKGVNMIKMENDPGQTPGLYFLSIESNGRTVVQKLIKQ